MYTLVDVTETGARRGDDIYRYKQQQNYMTFLQTISLRSNPSIHKNTNEKTDLINYNFGEKHKGKHQVWIIEFHFEAENSHSADLMKKDLDYVPIITGINETAKFPTKAFITNGDPYRNTIIVEI
jgi:hypothetical protein